MVDEINRDNGLDFVSESGVAVRYDSNGDVAVVQLPDFDVEDFETALLAAGVAAPKPFAKPHELKGIPFFITGAIVQPFSEANPTPSLLCTIVTGVHESDMYLSLSLETRDGGEHRFRAAIRDYFGSPNPTNKARALGPCRVVIANEGGKDEFIMLRSFVAKTQSMQTVASESRML